MFLRPSGSKPLIQRDAEMMMMMLRFIFIISRGTRKKPSAERGEISMGFRYMYRYVLCRIIGGESIKGATNIL